MVCDGTLGDLMKWRFSTHCYFGKDASIREARDVMDTVVESLPENDRAELRRAFLAAMREPDQRADDESHVQLLLTLLSELARKRVDISAIVVKQTGEESRQGESVTDSAPVKSRSLSVFRRSLATSFENLLGGRNRVR